jgi:superfamily II DNA or RNA helicase
MARKSRLSYDRGTLILHPPPKGKAWLDYATWDDRIEKFRIPASYYRSLVETLEANNIDFIDVAKDFCPLDIGMRSPKEPYEHQLEALEAWKKANRQGVVVLPTGAGKTYLAQLAMASTPRSTLIIVPTLDLMHQWYAELEACFENIELGLLGGGSSDRTSVLISTYHSAAIHAQTLGSYYGLLIFDECHHLPTDFFRVIAEESIAPYRLGLTATPERGDGSHQQLQQLIGEIVYRKSPQELSGNTLASYQIKPIKVELSESEKQEYQKAIETRNAFLRKNNIYLSGLQGWELFVKASATSQEGRRAMLAHRRAKEIALGTSAKLRVLTKLIQEHYPDKILIFTNDNATVYRISQEYLIPAITHQTPVKERHLILTKYKTGEYKAIVASHVLNEGVDVPSAKIAIIISGTASNREYVQRLGRILRKGDSEKLAILYEIIAQDTNEERIASKRKEKIKSSPEQQKIPIYYQNNHSQSLKAAEPQSNWQE